MEGDEGDVVDLERKKEGKREREKEGRKEEEGRTGASRIWTLVILVQKRVNH